MKLLLCLSKDHDMKTVRNGWIAQRIRNWMEVNGELHFLSALPAMKESVLQIGWAG
jgi:hypothetical protein